MKTQTTTDREIYVSRLIDAPRERVWQAFTDPQQIGKWWGPFGFTTDAKDRQFKVGGTWKHTMIGPDGTPYPNLGKFLEIVELEKIVYTNGGGKKGAPGTQHTNTITFTAKGNKTEVAFRLVFDDPDEKDLTEKTYGATQGGNQTLLRLDEYLHPFAIERVFDAPRERVWRALTDAKELNQWMSPKGMKPTKATVDLKVGGVYHYGMQSPDGSIMWGKQTYVEIEAPRKLTVIVSFSDENRGVTRHPMAASWPLETLSTTVLEELPGGKTKMSLRWTAYNAKQDEYEMFLKSFDGMKGGWGATMDQLAEHLKTMA